MCLTFIIRTTIGVSKIDWLKVFVVPFFPLVLLIFDEKVNLCNRLLRLIARSIN
jgi:hypothetical protein